MSALVPDVRLADVVSPAPRDLWWRAVEDDPTALADQTPAWVDAITAAEPYRDASRLYRFEDGRHLVLPLVRRTGPVGAVGLESSFPDGWGIGGPVGAPRDRDTIAAVLADLRGRTQVLTRVRPNPLEGDLWEAAAGPDVVRRPRLAHVLDLGDGVDAIRAGMRSGTRRNVNKSERAGLRVTDTATAAHLAAYHRLFVLSLNRWAGRSREPRWLAEWRGTRRDPLEKLQTLAEALGDRFRLWLAWEDGDAIAGAIVLAGRASHYTRGAMDRDRAAPTRAGHLLQWRAIEEAVAAGCRSHHFGDTGTSASLAQYKEGFGARPVPYADYGVERLPLTRADRALRSGVKRVIGFRDGA